MDLTFAISESTSREAFVRRTRHGPPFTLAFPNGFGKLHAVIP